MPVVERVTITLEAENADLKRKLAEAQSELDKLKGEGQKGGGVFDRMTEGLGRVRSALGKLLIPLAFIGTALKVVDIIEMWRTKGDAFRGTLDEIVQGFEATVRASSAAGRGGPLGDALRDVGAKAQAAMQQITAAANQQSMDTGRVIKGLLGVDLTDEEIAEETRKRLNVISQITNSSLIPLAEKAERARKAEEKKARDEKVLADVAAAQDTYNAIYLRSLSGEDKIREAARQSIEKLNAMRAAANNERSRSTLDAAIAMEKKATEAAIVEYKRREVEKVNAEIRALEAAADREQRQIRAVAKANADAIKAAFASINQRAQSVNNPSGIEVDGGRILELLSAIERRVGGPL